jgi:hypothetical protein
VKEEDDISYDLFTWDTLAFDNYPDGSSINKRINHDGVITYLRIWKGNYISIMLRDNVTRIFHSKNLLYSELVEQIFPELEDQSNLQQLSKESLSHELNQHQNLHKKVPLF